MFLFSLVVLASFCLSFVSSVCLSFPLSLCFLVQPLLLFRFIIVFPLFFFFSSSLTLISRHILTSRLFFAFAPLVVVLFVYILHHFFSNICQYSAFLLCRPCAHFICITFSYFHYFFSFRHLSFLRHIFSSSVFQFGIFFNSTTLRLDTIPSISSGFSFLPPNRHFFTSSTPSDVPRLILRLFTKKNQPPKIHIYIESQ